MPWRASKAAKMSNEECLACHNDATLTKEENGKQVSLHVDDAAFKASIHSTFGCTDCHTDIKAFPHDPTPAMPKCATCHSDEQAAYDHGSPRQGRRGRQHERRQVPGLPRQCPHHSSRQRSEVEGSAHQHSADLRRMPRTEAGDELPAASASTTFGSYEQSVHGKAVAGGSEKAAVCTDCHGAHDILGGGDPKSTVFKFNVPDTCAKCHAEVAAEIQGQHPRPADRAGQLAVPGVYRLPWNSHHQGAKRSRIRR